VHTLLNMQKSLFGNAENSNFAIVEMNQILFGTKR